MHFVKRRSKEMPFTINTETKNKKETTCYFKKLAQQLREGKHGVVKIDRRYTHARDRKLYTHEIFFL